MLRWLQLRLAPYSLIGGSFLIQELLRLSYKSPLSVLSSTWLSQQLLWKPYTHPFIPTAQLWSSTIQFFRLILHTLRNLSIKIVGSPTLWWSLLLSRIPETLGARISWPKFLLANEKVVCRRTECLVSFKANSQPMDYRGETFKGISEKGKREKQGVYVRAKNLLGEQESESIFPGHPLFPLQHPISPKQDNVSGQLQTDVGVPSHLVLTLHKTYTQSLKT